MKITVLASGSKGNATLIETKEINLLIDCGISYKQVIDRALSQKIHLNRLDGVLLTHEHIDHTRGLPVLLANTKATLYTPIATYDYLITKSTYNIELAPYIPIEPDVTFWIGKMEITPISISHDAMNTIGFIIKYQDKKLVYMTDVGFLPTSDYEKLKDANLYIFEANYDVGLLFSSMRPYYLKKRIDSIRGHLSNQDAAYHLSKMIGPNTKTIILAHPSEECNTPQHAISTIVEMFTSYAIDLSQYNVIVAKQQSALDSIEI